MKNHVINKTRCVGAASKALLALPVAAFAWLAGANDAHACSAPSIVLSQPVDGGTLKVSRIAGAQAGAPDAWDMRYDAYFCNPTSTAFTVTSVLIEHLQGTTVKSSVALAPVSPASVAASSTNQLVMVRDDTLYAFPLPSAIRITFTLSTGTKIAQTLPVAEHVNPGPLHAYFFPFRQSDLPAGAYWFQSRHAEDNTFQRWAYDLTVQQWNGSAWIGNKPGTDGTHTADSLTFDRPVYAMSDGLVIGCNRGGVDNTPATTNGNVPGGNLLWIRTGNETTLYAHLKNDSIPFSLCPFTDDAQHQLGDPTHDSPANDKYRVHAGQLLGHTGVSGFSRSGGSHLHIHTFMGLPAIWGGSETGIDADARPIEFVNVRVQAAGSGNVDPAKWNAVASRSLLPYNARIEGNVCGFDPSAVAGKPEMVNVGIPGNCFLEMANAMAEGGDQIWSIDVHGLGATSNSSTVWRPVSGGVATVVAAGLSDAELDAARHTWIDQYDYRFQQVEAYTEGGVVKHAVIFRKGLAGGAQLMRRNIDDATLQSYTKAEEKAGYVLVNLSVAAIGNARKYDLLLEKKSVPAAWSAWSHAIPIASYQDAFNAQAKAGRSLAYLKGYDFDGKAFISAIWYEAQPATAALHGQTQSQIDDAIKTNEQAGRLTHGITEYVDGKTVYGAFWRAGQ